MTVPNHAGFPQWGCGCNALHAGNQPNKARYPDFLLRRSNRAADHAAIGEIKTWWTYGDRLFQHIFRTVNQNTHQIQWNLETGSAKLLKQSRLGFVTNGKLVMLVAQLGNNTMIVSQLRQWDDMSILLGLTNLFDKISSHLVTSEKDTCFNVQAISKHTDKVDVDTTISKVYVILELTDKERDPYNRDDIIDQEFHPDHLLPSPSPTYSSEDETNYDSPYPIPKDSDFPPILYPTQPSYHPFQMEL
ncbi:hypothetical protein Clacol_009646 [Clathrus columnatus]|uniref:Fungal-type protein kinase domain-containing protein n=1 Tax=Clathrus columnatus TaxID=1419009 RepID=A0AAV5AU02_9AGAM|nr:hypothetical protein Clacol_009646 [Clathrus columnatus]